MDRIIVAGCAAATLVASTTMLAFTFRKPFYGDSLESHGETAAKSGFCDELYIEHTRPWRFTAKHGPYSCPWPAENTAFRATLGSVGILLTALAAYLVKADEVAWLRRVSVIYAIYAACWLSCATLDADAVRRGNALCESDFKVTADGNAHRLLEVLGKIDCQPAPFVWLTIGDFLNVLLFATVGYAWRVYAVVSIKHLQTTNAALQDPFLAATMSGAIDRQTPYEPAPSDSP
ncbi:hypothetical protein CTAYLR_006834 [Chrysophaeum taylorii]|uniref:Uncharacterized protein n=1 Tax=Chrysophaeum taylorii TaxID=2483200 RepID=A0AAD7UD64_9STRA|nr:hypothetical protein CTAYLR_006834 [Chrysophaeum taylorii]